MKKQFPDSQLIVLKKSRNHCKTISSTKWQQETSLVYDLSALLIMLKHFKFLYVIYLHVVNKFQGDTDLKFDPLKILWKWQTAKVTGTRHENRTRKFSRFQFGLVKNVRPSKRSSNHANKMSKQILWCLLQISRRPQMQLRSFSNSNKDN